ncbi:MAG: hypothetical protein AMJ42_05280 [Deltaproteobacteria bacterium DG_8]|nr:MAG: hypothetical protein AMJ42_05280 [Deltaproteobacteria bacterium DG_8]
MIARGFPQFGQNLAFTETSPSHSGHFRDALLFNSLAFSIINGKVYWVKETLTFLHDLFT